MLIGSVHDLDAPASPVLALLIAFSNHFAGFSERRIARSLKIRMPLPLGGVHKAAFGSEVEVVQSSFRPVLRGEG